MVYTEKNGMMFLDNFWNIQCEFINDHMGRWGNAFNIQSITKDEIKRVVNVDFEIADYECFKKALKNFKFDLSVYPLNPYNTVQYKHNVITLFVKSQEEIYELEDYDFADEDLLIRRRKDAYFSFCSEQLKYWGDKEHKARLLLDVYKRSLCEYRYENMNLLYIKELEKDIEHLERNLNCMRENCEWYSGKISEQNETSVIF